MYYSGNDVFCSKKKYSRVFLKIRLWILCALSSPEAKTSKRLKA